MFENTSPALTTIPPQNRPPPPKKNTLGRRDDVEGGEDLGGYHGDDTDFRREAMIATETSEPPSKLTKKQTYIDANLGTISADLRAALRDKKRRGTAYLQLFAYLLFVSLYMFVVYLQSDVFNAYSVVSSVRSAFVPAAEEGSLKRMSDSTEVLDWLVDAVEPIWQSTVCGDGDCNEPYEFPAYGRFGCRPDCGVAKDLAQVLLQIKADFRDDFASPLALQGAASWNLCQRNEAAKEAGFPDICWWESDKTFDSVTPNQVETFYVPAKSLWYVRVLGDHKGRVEGNVYLVEGTQTPWVGTVPEWKHCTRAVKSTRGVAASLAVTQPGRRRRSRSLLLEEVERQVQEGIALGEAEAAAEGAAAKAAVAKSKILGEMPEIPAYFFESPKFIG